MTIATKKLKNGFTMPVYGLGTWGMGGKRTHDSNNDDQADITAIQTAIDNGITHIDTAEAYAQGYCETLVGEAIKDHARDKLFLVSKVQKDHLGYDDLMQAATKSLERLKTDYLDLYLLHEPNPSISIAETMKAMDTLVEERLIKYIGVSNFNVEEIKEAQACTKHGIVAAQMHLNLQYRESERRGVLKYCQENDIMFIAWRPLQKGSVLDTPILQEMANKYHKTPAQIALNWLISQENVVTISKTRDLDHLKENLGSLDWTMEKEDIEKLRKDFPDQQDISNSNPLNP